MGYLAINGAHHRLLLDSLAQKGGRTGAWLTGDIAALDRRGAGTAGLGEVGLFYDAVPQVLRIGLGGGVAYAHQQQANGGSNRIDGQYAVGEIDLAIPQSPIVVSVLGLVGTWGVDTVRNYGVAGSASSSGHTRVGYAAVRGRIDWHDAVHLGGLRFSPVVAFTHGSGVMRAYQESGGTAPAAFARQRQSTDELRTTLTAAYRLSPSTELRGSVDYVHRLDASAGSLVVANVLGVVNVPATFGAGRLRQDWARFGADIEHTIGTRGAIIFSANASTPGQDPDFGGSIGYRLRF